MTNNNYGWFTVSTVEFLKYNFLFGQEQGEQSAWKMAGKQEEICKDRQFCK